MIYGESHGRADVRRGSICGLSARLTRKAGPTAAQHTATIYFQILYARMDEGAVAGKSDETRGVA